MPHSEFNSFLFNKNIRRKGNNMEELDIKQILKFMYQRKNIFIYILLAALLVGMLYTFVIKN